MLDVISMTSVYSTHLDLHFMCSHCSYMIRMYLVYPMFQLNRQMKANSDVFRNFEEGIPNFDPTYKFDPGTDNYDSR